MNCRRTKEMGHMSSAGKSFSSCMHRWSRAAGGELQVHTAVSQHQLCLMYTCAGRAGQQGPTANLSPVIRPFW